ncbi:hypothetical protein D3C71_1780710 [compost metagenome]
MRVELVDDDPVTANPQHREEVIVVVARHLHADFGRRHLAENLYRQDGHAVGIIARRRALAAGNALQIGLKRLLHNLAAHFAKQQRIRMKGRLQCVDIPVVDGVQVSLQELKDALVGAVHGRLGR